VTGCGRAAPRPVPCTTPAERRPAPPIPRSVAKAAERTRLDAERQEVGKRRMRDADAPERIADATGDGCSRLFPTVGKPSAGPPRPSAVASVPTIASISARPVLLSSSASARSPCRAQPVLQGGSRLLVIAGLPAGFLEAIPELAVQPVESADRQPGMGAHGAGRVSCPDRTGSAPCRSHRGFRREASGATTASASRRQGRAQSWRRASDKAAFPMRALSVAATRHTMAAPNWAGSPSGGPA
jgi:hypothetical protein